MYSRCETETANAYLLRNERLRLCDLHSWVDYRLLYEYYVH